MSSGACLCKGEAGSGAKKTPPQRETKPNRRDGGHLLVKHFKAQVAPCCPQDGGRRGSRWLCAKPVNHLSFMWHHTYHKSLAGGEFGIPTPSQECDCCELILRADSKLQGNGLDRARKGCGDGSTGDQRHCLRPRFSACLWLGKGEFLDFSRSSRCPLTCFINKIKAWGTFSKLVLGIEV